MKPRALISVSDKQGIVEFSQGLLDLGYEIVSTGGTAKLLSESGLPVVAVDEVTGFPECLDGRVKTLHPRIHGGILAIRSRASHVEKLDELDIRPIDMVVVNLYPFRAVVENPGHTLEQAIENIDIGGPSMIRAAAKNYPFVTVVTDSGMYGEVLERAGNGGLDEQFRFSLAVKAFSHTAAYDAMISGYLNKVLGVEYPDTLTMTFEKKQELRYGENPHQSAAYYQTPMAEGRGLERAVFLHGKELSYNNINDAQGAVDLVREFDEPVCVAVKHATPCGVGVGETVSEAYRKAYEADPAAIFGGIVCFNREVDLETAEKMNEIFLEVIIAPGYSEAARACLTTKKNVRILILPLLNERPEKRTDFKSVAGGLLVQGSDASDIGAEKTGTVTKAAPSESELRDLKFAMKVVKHVKSNAVVIAKNGKTLGIGGGAVSRIGAAKTALEHAAEEAKGAVMASDAYFPFPDVVSLCGEYGVSAIIQPGGSKNDQLSIDECDRLGIAMSFTGVRHFRH